jgi:carbamoyl-phosphate synthase small subunit
MLESSKKLKATLVLQDGTIFRGFGFGYSKRIVGEVVFNTGMVGYPEALTDPSYKGQILCFTYPLIGNYGIPYYSNVDEFNLPIHFESNKIQVSGLIVSELCKVPSHWTSKKTLNDWLYEEGIPAIEGIDTRELTKKLRVRGVMMGCLDVSNNYPSADELLSEIEKEKKYEEINFVKQVSINEPITYKPNLKSKGRVVLMDYGVKLSIIRNLLRRGYEVVRLPYNYGFKEVLSYEPKGVLLSNGPGDPQHCKEAIRLSKELADSNIPTLGICLGNQILALGLGGKTYKLKYGHRGQNKPCTDLIEGRSYVTSQNHGYAVEAESLDSIGLDVWFINADDKTVEGITLRDGPCIAVQFHPEASPGPYDTEFVFDIFDKIVKEVKPYRGLNG